MNSEGQGWALEQLREIEQVPGNAFEIVDVSDPTQVALPLKVTLSVNCRGYRRVDGGVPLRPRERIRVDVPAGFPLDRPSAYFTHKQYAEYPHVQWGNYICLYQAPETEWQASDGMFGYIERLHEWLAAAASNQLDPIGMPLHPPVTYTTSKLHVVPRHDAPVVEPPFWSGFVEIDRETDIVVELGRWIGSGEDIPSARLASAILLSSEMPHEYPSTMLDLLNVFESRHIPFPLIRLTMLKGVLVAEEGKPAIFIMGARMRGIAGEGRQQHLTAWVIDPEQAAKLRVAAIEATPENPIDIEQFYAWAADAKIEWCRVLEDRPEIVERRDSESLSSWWRGRHVAILGCGAIGSSLSVMLARAGVRKLQLYDNSVVTPGILVRQQFDRRQIGYGKSSAAKVNVLNANPDVETAYYQRDVAGVLRDEEALATLMEADVIIDATASTRLAAAFEHRFKTTPKTHPPVISMSLGHKSDFAMMTLSTASHPGMMLDRDRRSKIAFANSGRAAAFLEEFWPASPDRNQLFRPEPGCSHPTFRGAAVDVLALVTRMTNMAAKWLSEATREHDRVYALNLSNRSNTNSPIELDVDLSADRILNDARHGYQIRLSQTALSTMISWIRRSERVNGSRAETGGLLFGQADEFLKVIWIDEVSGPPPDSFASPLAFICGTAGLNELHQEKKRRTRGSVGFVGMWHTHPYGVPVPSTTDLKAMEKLLAGNDYLGRRFLMMIVGGAQSSYTISGNVFERAEYRH
ncbi:hypothetical protein HJC04_00800 [Rhizobium sp. NLR8a]|uniref:ThiF family adenylyltransferase n=1 Tax=Rhizobium sp. NLR8a TaxID=2731119 RepID=UPI001C8375AE|nr:ThiF family adenylyltransferase [Rhizobium sp. NLR8a]MBX5218896.1 hypothetical protein [Rhizobium sp. NLR8a]